MNLDLAGYHLTYDQEFTNPQAFVVSPDGTVGFKDQYDWGGRNIPNNKEAEFYEDPSLGVNPFGVQDGALSITGAYAPSGVNTDGFPYTSGMITTQNTFSQHGGYWEMRAQVAGGQGLWPAFWLLPTTLRDYPEMDIMEDPNLGAGNQYWVHATGQTGGGGGFFSPGPMLAGGYHRYGVEWNDHTTTFYFDGQALSEYSTPPDFLGLNMYFLANLAIGGINSWPGTPGPSSIPVEYNIDYIRVYSNNTKMPKVVLQQISSPDGANTKPVMKRLTFSPVITGAGTDALVLNTADQYYAGDAQFTVSIDVYSRAASSRRSRRMPARKRSNSCSMAASRRVCIPSP
jgi:beta-glucanase (GH16 family)